jgi:hypothetical protein
MYGHTSPTVRSTEEGEQVGPKMHRCVRAVASGPYPSMNQLAKTVGPNGSQQYGYKIVHRCKRKGLLELDDEHPVATTHGRGAVVITEKGERYLSNHED